MKRNILKPFSRYILIGLLSFYGLCQGGDSEPPGEIDDLTFFWDAEALTQMDGDVFITDQVFPPDTRSLALTATGDNDDEGEASQYDLRYFDESEYISANFEDDWEDAHELTGEDYPSPSGEIDALFLPRLVQSIRYYFAIKAKDEIGEDSDVSNVCGPVLVPLITIPLIESQSNWFMQATALAGVGDLNNDELPDFAVGVPAYGEALIYLGLDMEDYTIEDNVQGAELHRAKWNWGPDIAIYGNAADAFGATLEGVGFVYGYEIPFIITGAPNAQSGAGRVYIFSGTQAIASPIWSDNAYSVITGDAAGDAFGAALTECNDLNNDGFHDFAAASHGSNKVYVFLGGNSGAPESLLGSLPTNAHASEAAALIISQEAALDEFGATMDCGHDLNADNIPDLVVSAPNSQGRGAVYIFYGGDAGIVNFTSEFYDRTVKKFLDLAVNSADVTIRGTVDGARFGEALKLAGDLLGRSEDDPATDLAVSAVGLEPGKVFIFYGGDEGNIIFPYEIITPLEELDIKRDIQLCGETGQEFGRALGGARDFNNSGNDDLVIGAPAAGQVTIYFWDETIGPEGMARYHISHPDPSSRFGEILSTLPDFNSDILPELIIAAPQEGKVYFEF
jgi:hypothetical protein